MFTEIILVISISAIIYLIFINRQGLKKIDRVDHKNEQFIESIEKYVEIFNENNIKELLAKIESPNDKDAEEKISQIRDEYRTKLKNEAGQFSEEQEMLIDFITLTLSLLIKTPPTLRKKLIEDNTDNEIIKTILISKLPSIEMHYIPVSILEIALAKNIK
jgi:hypothetical protein